jgi:cytochrome o ubiquinol oxidase subunit 2
MSSNFSGDGFSHMKFAYHGVPPGRLRRLGAEGQGQRQRSTGRLPGAGKAEEKEPVRRYGTVEPTCYYRILNRCVAEGAVCMNHQMMMDTPACATTSRSSRCPRTPSAR